LSQLGLIAFTGTDEKIWIVNADGTNLRQWESALPGGGVVSPDGRFYATGNYCVTIYSNSADGIYSLEKEIVLENDAYCSNHAWSPYGKYLAFLGQYELYLVNPEDWDVQKISYVPDDQAVYSFSWSPDGERIALYRGLGEGAFSNEDMFKNTGIDLVTINGAQETLISGILSAPVIFWSQDGSQLIFGGNVITMNGDEFTVGETGLYTLEIQYKKLERVGDTTWDMYPIPSPDQQYIAFINDQDFPLHHEIFVLDTSTFEVKRLTDNKFDDDGLTWLPDSQHIVYHSSLGRGGLYVVSVVTGLEHRLTYSGKNPFWLPALLASSAGQPAPSVITSSTPVPVRTATSQAVVTASAGIPKWNKLSATAGLPVRGMQAVYDSDRKVIVLFGGTNDAELTLSDTWEFDGKTWKRVNIPDSPPARFWHGMAYDSQRKVVVLFGGETSTSGGSLLDDTWEYDGKTWIKINTVHKPAPRGSAPLMAFDSCRGRIVLFGGQDASGLPIETWEYDGRDWIQVKTAMSPLGRALSSMIFDPYRCRVVLFGGGNFGQGLNDTWEYDGKNWQKVATVSAPTGRWGHAVVYNPLTGHIVLFGGYDAIKSVDDTWIYDGMNWRKAVPTGKPSSREQHTLAFDGVNGSVVMVGGYGSDGNWAFSEGSSQATATPSTNPGCALGFTRLQIGDNTRVTPGLPNRARSAPGIYSDVLTELLPGTVVKVVDGPVCADGYVFWKVESELIPGGSGWTAEGDGSGYWLEPYQP